MLFQPFKLGHLTLRNRIAVSPMTMSASDDGFITDFLFAHYLSFAFGGAGLVMVEATAVADLGRISPPDQGIWKDEHVANLSRLASNIKKFGAVPAIQLHHAGRKASCKVLWEGGATLSNDDGGWDTIGPSAVPWDDKHITKVPKEATEEDIGEFVEQFVSAAQRAVDSGFQVIELHFAHGYLVHQFLSPLSNKREDQYGGSLEKRMKLALEITKAVVDKVGKEAVVGARVSSTDYVDNGWDIPSTVKLAKELKEAGLQFIDFSGMSAVVPWDPSIKDNPYETPFKASEAVSKEVDIVTMASGGIHSGKYAESLLKDNKVSLLMIGRSFLDDHQWPHRAAAQLNAAIDDHYPSHYGYAIGDKFREKAKEQINKYGHN